MCGWFVSTAARSLRHLTQEKETIQKGMECGVVLDRTDLKADAASSEWVQVGDLIECFVDTSTPRVFDDSMARGAKFDSPNSYSAGTAAAASASTSTEASS